MKTFKQLDIRYPDNSYTVQNPLRMFRMSSSECQVPKHHGGKV